MKLSLKVQYEGNMIYRYDYNIILDTQTTTYIIYQQCKISIFMVLQWL